MRKFQVGDKIRCINIIDNLNGRPYLYLTLNKIYTVIGIGCYRGFDYVEILNDMDISGGFYENRFEKIDDTAEELNFLDILKGY